MKTLKRIPLGYLIALGIFLSLGATYSAKTMMEIGPIAKVTGANPEINFFNTGGTMMSWEVEGFNGGFEIGEEGNITEGMFKIFPNAMPDAATLTSNGVVVGSEFLTTTERLSVVGDGTRASLELVPELEQNANARIVAEDGPNTVAIEARGTGSTFEQIFRSSLDAPEDSLTIQPSPFSPTSVVRVGIPFSEPISNVGSLHIDSGGLLIDTAVTTERYHLGNVFAGIPDFAIQHRKLGVTEIPFFIAEEATSYAITIGNDNNVGVGLKFADASLHVLREDGTAALKVEETGADSGGTALREMMRLENNGGVAMALSNTDSGDEWEFTNNNAGNFQINLQGTGGPELRVSKVGGLVAGPGGFRALDSRPNGNLFIAGSLSEMSDRNSKENYKSIDCDEILSAIADLDVTTWNYKTDNVEVRHIGPVAQDFHKAFGLGHNDTTISTSDKVGVNMAAIKALNIKLKTQEAEFVAKVNSKDEKINELTDRLQRLEELVQRMN